MKEVQPKEYIKPSDVVNARMLLEEKGLEARELNHNYLIVI